MSSFKYTALPDGHIRLVELEHDGSLTISTHHMAKVPPFTALSYVWGDSSEQMRRKIRCHSHADEGTLALTPNLYEAIPYLRQHSELPIWIDAICIDQGSGTEKEVMLPKMTRIYRQASNVLIWLGPAADESDLAMDVLNQLDPNPTSVGCPTGLPGHHIASILATLARGGSLDITEEEFQRRGLPPVKHPIWEALLGLYRRAWNTRVWTFPEAKLAKEAVILCGTKSLPWATYLVRGQQLARTQLLYTQTNNGSIYLSPFEYPTSDASLFLILRLTRNRKCTLKEDRILALLGLVSDDLQDDILAEYGDYRALYQKVGTMMLRRGLDALLASASSPTPPGLPSWCPDWSVPTTSHGTFTQAEAGYPMKHKASYTQRSAHLLVHGACIDRVAQVVDDYALYWPKGVAGEDGPAHRILRWLDVCMSIARRCRLSERVCWETLVGYVPGVPLSKWGTLPSSLEAAFRVLRLRLDENRRSIPLADTAITKDERAELVHLTAYLGMVWHGRVFFSTEKGRIGFADRGTEKGDVACVFFGEPQMYVLRQRLETGDTINPQTTFVSRSYIHGAMLGEACATLTDKDDVVFEIS